MPWAARSSARGAKWPSPCRLPVKPWHSTTSGSSSPRADLAGSWMVAGILPRVPGISMFLGLVLGCNSVTAATMHSAMAAKQASRIQGARVCLACFIWVPLSGFFRFIVLPLKRIQGGLSIVSCSSPLMANISAKPLSGALLSWVYYGHWQGTLPSSLFFTHHLLWNNGSWSANYFYGNTA